ncbi:VOC family protein [Paenibacillus sp. NEAU-GSW1]|uniref:VOC family protein n=1 Tax=Paenibacillus sp. NEAU-GSW1 TaxID=2682486 RepID=UPI0012E14BB9|nr:VOC family protein [Paenibacillus sp. NEAU-GSW1]MUT64642.1 glyoxalase/bleomycin resistance/dioxygenase family protein [Paenibacillus sp. NEAU-GSW1]
MIIKETGFILFLENYEEHIQFYTEKLGLKVREKDEGLSKLEFGGSYLMVEHQGVSSRTEKSRSQNPTVIRIEVEDFDAAVTELEQRGVAVEVQPHSWGTIGIIVDPEGNRIELKKF